MNRYNHCLQDQHHLVAYIEKKVLRIDGTDSCWHLDVIHAAIKLKAFEVSKLLTQYLDNLSKQQCLTLKIIFGSLLCMPCSKINALSLPSLSLLLALRKEFKNFFPVSEFY